MASKANPRNEKAAEARKKAQAQVRAQERKTATIIAAVAAAAIVIFGGVVFFIVQSSSIPSLSDSGAVLPAGSDATGGIPVGTTGVVGVDVPEDATRVDIYLDYMCPVCAQFEVINAEDLDTLREEGTIALYFHPISILDRASAGTEFSTRSANAAGTVADLAPEAFLDFNNAMFANQPTEGTTGLDDATIEQIALESGVPADVASQLADGKFTKWVIAATDQSSQDGVGGTPTVMVDGEILDQAEVAYFAPGALKAYLESLS